MYLDNDQTSEKSDFILTIVVPSYNTEAYVDQCLGSMMGCALSGVLEILLVDDGSSDRTAEIAKNYSRYNSDAVRVVSKVNGGHGSAVNTGIHYARGRYIKIVDGDDWVNSLNLRRFLDQLEDEHADLILTPYTTVDESRMGKNQRVEACGLPQGSYSFDEIPIERLPLQMHAMTIRTSIFIDNGIKFTEHCFYDDFQFATYPMPFIESVKVIDIPIYCYRIGQASQSVSDASVLKNEWMHLKIINESIDILKQWQDMHIASEAVVKRMKQCISKMLATHYNIFIRNYSEAGSYESFIEFDNYMTNKLMTYREQTLCSYPHIRLALQHGRFGFALSGKLYRFRRKYFV